MGATPRAWVLAADWGNTIAGLILMCAFFTGALINFFQYEGVLLGPVDVIGSAVPSPNALKWLQRFFCAEGFFYALAEFFMVGIMANTPPEFGGGARGCMQFAILMAGGIFFSFSGLCFPPCITNPTYLFNKDLCKHPAVLTPTGPDTFDPLSGTPYVWNAMAHYGITCFMAGTTIGFTGILGAPKDKLVSPFWGVTMYFMGAWTIGIFQFWGPCLLGGFSTTQNEAAAGGFDFSAPAASWTFQWLFAFLGAGFLTTGAIIFGIMNGSFAAAPPAPPPAAPKSSDSHDTQLTSLAGNAA